MDIFSLPPSLREALCKAFEDAYCDLYGFPVHTDAYLSAGKKQHEHFVWFAEGWLASLNRVVEKSFAG